MTRLRDALAEIRGSSARFYRRREEMKRHPAFSAIGLARPWKSSVVRLSPLGRQPIVAMNRSTRNFTSRQNALIYDDDGWERESSEISSEQSGQVRCGGIGSASPHPPCDGTPPACVWPSPSQTSGPSCPYPSNRSPPDDLTTKHGGFSSAWPSPSDPDKNPTGEILFKGPPYARSKLKARISLADTHLLLKVRMWGFGQKSLPSQFRR